MSEKSEGVAKQVEGVLGSISTLYSLFILRDLLGKIAPGLLFILGMRRLIPGLAEEPLQMKFPGVVVVLIAAWFVGIAVQSLSNFARGLLSHRNPSLDTFVRFNRAATDREIAAWERTVVIKEASVNAAGTLSLLLLAGALISLGRSFAREPAIWNLTAIQSLAVLAGWVLAILALIRQGRESAANESAIGEAVSNAPQTLRRAA